MNYSYSIESQKGNLKWKNCNCPTELLQAHMFVGFYTLRNFFIKYIHSIALTKIESLELETFFVLVQLPIKSFLVVSSFFYQTFFIRQLQTVQIHTVPLTPSVCNMFWYYPKTIQKYFFPKLCVTVLSLKLLSVKAKCAGVKRISLLLTEVIVICMKPFTFIYYTEFTMVHWGYQTTVFQLSCYKCI